MVLPGVSPPGVNTGGLLRVLPRLVDPGWPLFSSRTQVSPLTRISLELLDFVFRFLRRHFSWYTESRDLLPPIHSGSYTLEFIQTKPSLASVILGCMLGMHQGYWVAGKGRGGTPMILIQGFCSTRHSVVPFLVVFGPPVVNKTPVEFVFCLACFRGPIPTVNSFWATSGLASSSGCGNEELASTSVIPSNLPSTLPD